MDKLKEYECVNCGYKAWSIRDVARCSRCNSLCICTEVPKPKVTIDKEGRLSRRDCI